MCRMSWLCPETYMLEGLVASQVGDYGNQRLIEASGAVTTPRQYIKDQYGYVPQQGDILCTTSWWCYCCCCCWDLKMQEHALSYHMYPQRVSKAHS